MRGVSARPGSNSHAASPLLDHLHRKQLQEWLLAFVLVRAELNNNKLICAELHIESPLQATELRQRGLSVNGVFYKWLLTACQQ